MPKYTTCSSNKVNTRCKWQVKFFSMTLLRLHHTKNVRETLCWIVIMNWHELCTFVKQNFVFCSKQLQLSLSTYQRSHPCDFVSAPTKTHTRSNEHLPEHCFFCDNYTCITLQKQYSVDDAISKKVGWRNILVSVSNGRVTRYNAWFEIMTRSNICRRWNTIWYEFCSFEWCYFTILLLYGRLHLT